MTLKKSTVIAFLFYISTIPLIVAVYLATSFGIPRIDTALAPVYTALFFGTLLIYKTPPAIRISIALWLVMIGAAFLSLLFHPSVERFLDTCFFSFIGFMFYISYRYLVAVNFSINKVRKFLFILSAILYAGFFAELFLGVELVKGNDELTVLEGAYKGLFFNSNDQAVVVTLLCAAISFFYIIKADNWKVRYLGYLLFLLGGVIVFISASRAALAGYLAMLLLTVFTSAHTFTKFVYTLLTLPILPALVDIRLLIPIFRFLSQFPMLERSVSRFELAIFDLGMDKSVDYRTEIYTKFLDNFHVILLGYSPRNYAEYFKYDPLSAELGYTNPHSFFIEIYLAFGLFGFLGFIAFLLFSIQQTYRSASYKFSEKTFYLFTVLLCCWLRWVPSSVLRLPIIWLPMFLIFLYSKKPTLINRI